MPFSRQGTSTSFTLTSLQKRTLSKSNCTTSDNLSFGALVNLIQQHSKDSWRQHFLLMDHFQQLVMAVSLILLKQGLQLQLVVQLLHSLYSL